MALPIQGVAYDFYLGLTDVSNPDEFKSAPTIAAGDFQVSIDGSTFANLSTLPVVTPTGSITVKVTLSASEMAGEKISIKAIDASGSEWGQALVAIDVAEATTETLFDIQEGDRIEDANSLIINKKGTTTALISKTIGGSLYSGTQITTTEP